MNVSIIIPKDVVPESIDPRQTVLDAALMAIEKGLSPVPPPKDTNNHNIKAYLNQSVLSRIRGRPQDMPLSQYLASCAYAWFVNNKPSVESPMTQLGLRAEQTQLISGCEAGIKDKMVVFAEAGTGVGKTRAALVMAARFVQNTGQPAVYVVPSLAVLGQSVREYSELTADQLGGARKPRLAFLLGRQNFVDTLHLQSILQNPEELEDRDIAAARAWFEAGGPFVEGAKTESLHASVPNLSWLVEDLQIAAPAFPVETIRLADEAELCPAYQQYQKFLEDALTAEIIVCTHAMLGVDIMRRGASRPELENRLASLSELIEEAKQKEQTLKVNYLKKRRTAIKKLLNAFDDDHVPTRQTVLPDYKLLVIDEGHMLESSMASLKSSELNPRLFHSDIESIRDEFVEKRAKATCDAIIKIINELQHALISAGKTIEDDRIRITGNSVSEKAQSLKELILDKLQDLDDLKLNNLIKKSSLIRSRLSPLMSVVRNLKYGGDAVVVNFSPRRRYPSITTGPQSVSFILERIWDRVDAAVIMSATLALPDRFGNPRVTYLANTLSVPKSRIYIIPPIVQPWLYSATLYPRGRKRKNLLTPDNVRGDRTQSDDVQKWAKSIAREIIDIANTAKGGVLVLNTSFDRINVVSDHLSDLKKRLIIQSPKKGLKICQSEFEKIKKPVWMALGAAWTGLDLSLRNIPPNEDFLLTDLVITTIPFGTNRTTTHVARTEWNKVAERERAALEFKQGIGRLVRREGLQCRRIHILDPRIWVDSKFYLPFRKILENYPECKK